MNISILDLVLFQRHPEEMKRDTPEKYYEVQKYLSERENRSKFFKTIEELENDSSISSEDRSLENEFSEFWKKFQKDCCTRRSSRRGQAEPLSFSVRSLSQPQAVNGRKVWTQWAMRARRGMERS